MKKYKYNCSTYEVLLWESELEPKPESHLITIPAKENDLALANGIEYVFQNGEWIKGNDNNVTNN